MKFELRIEGGDDKPSRKRPRKLAKALYEPVEDGADLAELETRARAKRRRAFQSLGTFAAVSAFLAAINVATSGVELLLRPWEAWCLYPILGMGIAVGGKATSALFSLPRALRFQRALLAAPAVERGPAPERDVGALRDEIGRRLSAVRQLVRALEPARIDLEATLDVSARETMRLADALELCERAERDGRIRGASADRLTGFAAERARLWATLEGYRVTLANLEVDALLLSGPGRAAPHTFDALATESELLHASAEAHAEALRHLGLSEGAAPPQRLA